MDLLEVDLTTNMATVKGGPTTTSYKWSYNPL